MKKTAWPSRLLIVCALGAIWFSAHAQLKGGSSGPGGNEPPEPSPCLTEATLQIAANPTSVTYGQASVVSWSVVPPARCGSLTVRLNGQPVAASGSRSVTPPASATYTVIVSETRLGVYAQRSVSAQVGVVYPPRVVINQSTSNPASVLVGALGSTNPSQTIELCNVDIDLTGRTGIAIGSNRSLIGSPGCERNPRRLGPRIFVTDKRGGASLFVIQGDNVRVSGFRLEGPTSGIAQGDVKEKGILIAPPPGREPIRSIEISNMEIFHWSGVGVQVIDNVDPNERGRLFNTNPGAVRIRGNFFHHNRHGAGEGYGVAVTDGAYATIEQNVFDENRHAIAGGSRNDDALDYSGYTLRDNLILSGGGLHSVDAWYGFFMCFWQCNSWYTHQIDMHGDKNAWYSSHNWQCGTAGETMIIERNTVLYTNGLAIKIRGNPADKVVVDGNVFKHKKRGDAIAQNGGCGWGDNITKPIDVRPNNVFRADPMAELGSCDFFGDGQQDQFMATGVTWWAKSPVTQQWRYLNTMRERLSELQLGRVDNDAVCDVAPRTSNAAMLPEKYSKSGTGPWVPLLVIKP